MPLCSFPLDFYEVLSVVAQLFDRLVYVGERFVLPVLRKPRHDRRLPASGKLLQCAHIEVAVEKVSFELRHVPREKTAVLMHGIAAHRRNLRGNVLHKKRDHLLLDLGLTER